MNEAAAGPEVLARIAGGAMLYDGSCLVQADAGVFAPAYWQSRGAWQREPGGRGTVAFLRTEDDRQWVLRHYRRGGLVARVLDDQYLWSGAQRTRAFAEWRLLRQLRAWHLPVPRPIAARYLRRGILYRADLITEALPVRRTLAGALRQGALTDASWRAIGRCVAALHGHGVQHADLNAHNLLVGEDDAVYVLDFDRGRIRVRGAWERAVLERLHRSLLKVTRGLPAERFGDRQWQALLAAATS